MKWYGLVIRRQQLEALSAASPDGIVVQRCREQNAWIEVRLLGEDDGPIPFAAYQIVLPDRTVREGKLDERGSVRVEGIEEGRCRVNFPELDRDAWHPI